MPATFPEELLMAESTRPEWDPYWLAVAGAVAARADCTRRKVGAILVDSRGRLKGSGYNGGRSKGPSCLAGECPRGLMTKDQVQPGSSYDTGAGSCIALHAEQNLCLYTSDDERYKGTVYITDEPCGGCTRMLHGAGLVRIVWPGGYWFSLGSDWFRHEVST